MINQRHRITDRYLQFSKPGFTFNMAKYDKQHPIFKSVTIHASAVEFQGKALIFLGPSGTGKSTVSQLLVKVIEEVHPLADDVISLNWQNGRRWIVDNAVQPLPKERIELQSSTFFPDVPLGAVFRLYQASCPRLVPLCNLKTALYLIYAFSEMSQRQPASISENRAYFVSLAAIARLAPGYELYCDRSPRTADIIRQEASLYKQ
jgi:energy-coupling factor transporter ATP-binding protein EcfA2